MRDNQPQAEDIAEETANMMPVVDLDLDLSALMQDNDIQPQYAEYAQDDSAEIETAETEDEADADADTDADDSVEDAVAKGLAEFGALAELDAAETSETTTDDQNDDLFSEDGDSPTDDASQDVEDGDDDLENLLAEVREKVAAPQIPVHTRVLKIKRKDFEAAIARGQIEAADASSPRAR